MQAFQLVNETYGLESSYTTARLPGSLAVPSTEAGRLVSEGLYSQTTSSPMLSIGEGWGGAVSQTGYEQLSLPISEEVNTQSRIHQLLADQEFASLPKVAALVADSGLSDEMRLGFMESLYTINRRQQDKAARRHSLAVKAEVFKQGAREVVEFVSGTAHEVGIALKPATEFSAEKAKQLGGQVAVLALKGWENANKLAQRKLKTGLRLSRLILEEKGLIINKEKLSSAKISFICAREITATARALPTSAIELNGEQKAAQVAEVIRSEHPKLVENPDFQSLLKGFSNDPTSFIKAIKHKVKDTERVTEIEQSPEVREFMKTYGLKPAEMESENV